MIKKETDDLKVKNVDDYINTFPKEIQISLNQLRAIIKEKAPEAIESIAYQMPAYKINGRPLVYFAGFKNHIGFLCHTDRTLGICRRAFKIQAG